MVNGIVFGGDDTITINNSNDTQGSGIAGDVLDLNGGTVTGGNDKIVFIGLQGPLYVDYVAGDVATADAGTIVNGGNDTISGTSNGQDGAYLGGDAYDVDGATIDGGNDQITGTAEDDNIAGDIVFFSAGSLTGGNDKILGGLGNDRIYGESFSGAGTSTGGNDTLSGGDGDDSIYGQTGNDVLSGGLGDDRLEGGGGNDRVSFSAVLQGVSVDLSLLGTIGGAWGQGTDTLVEIEHVTGSNLDDAVTGNTTANSLNGMAGNDVLFGEDGADTLNGGAGNDDLRGGANADIIIGGLGRDTLQGNAGYDDFVFNTVPESGVSPALRDTIIGFQHNIDDIDLSTIDASAGTAGNNAFTFVGGAAFSAEGQIRVRQVGGDTYVDVNTTGATGVEMTIKLEGLVTVTAVDFIL
jgi:Ca2+-binding RTX toxin-like protein